MSPPVLDGDASLLDASLLDASLDSVRIASPCRANWDDMIGDDSVRFCQQCTKNVYNLSALPRGDAEALLRAALAREAEQGEGMCIRLYRRADGTVLTGDCPDGANRKRRRLAVFGALGGGLLAAGAAAELFSAAPLQGAMMPPRQVQGQTMMGEVAALPNPAPAVPPLTGPGGVSHTSWQAGRLLPPPPHAEVGKLRQAPYPPRPTPMMGAVLSAEPVGK